MKLFKSHPYLKLIAKNTFTLFNFVNVILAVMVALVGSYKNMLFIVIALANTLISIINGIRAEKIIKKLKLISEQRPTIEKDGRPFQIPPENVKKGDLLILGLGDQVPFDSVVKEGSVEVNESYITGESNNIAKTPGDRLYSGSFIAAGICKATVTAVGAENSLNRLESAAHTIKTADSQLFTLMNNIVKYISYTLIPIGILLLWARFRVPDTTTEVAVTSTVAALINMIPEGLILLTSSILALATIRLARKRVLVQDLYSIETLARVDTICLDKTGTLTTGELKVKDVIPAVGISKKALETALESILSLVPADNATSTALHERFARGAKNRVRSEIAKNYTLIPFSSDRKYSGIKSDNEELLIGALEFLTSDPALLAQAPSTSQRVLAVVRRPKEGFSDHIGGYDRDTRSASPVTTGASDSVSEKPSLDVLLGFITLEDALRKDAKQILRFFSKNDIDVKIISGDAEKTVVRVANQSGLGPLNSIDLSTVKNPNYDKLVKDYNIFARVTPTAKKSLILALKRQGRTVAMTGDGVNDILAMKEADASLAIASGADAARRSAKIVLLDSDFSAVPAIIAEGRQSINNLERSTSLFLAKTVYAGILAVLFVFLPLEYPFSPIKMSLLNFICIGFPGLILALEPNIARIKNQFVKNIVTYSVPTGITVALSALALAIFGAVKDLEFNELTTLAVTVTFIIDLALIYWVSKPLNKLRLGLLLTILVLFLLAYFTPLGRFIFEFTDFSTPALIAGGLTLALALTFLYFTQKTLKGRKTRPSNIRV